MMKSIRLRRRSVGSSYALLLTMLCAPLSTLAETSLRNAAPEARPPALLPETPATVRESGGEAVPGQPGEHKVLDRLQGLALVPDEHINLEKVPKGLSIEVEKLKGNSALALALQPFFGHMATLESLHRAIAIIRREVKQAGYPFALIYLPRQTVANGTIKIVVRLATLDGELKVDGAKWFSEQGYRQALGLKTGKRIDTRQIDKGLAYINRNPFRHARLEAAAGTRPGTTELALKVRERYPFRLFTGVDNTGTRNTGANRIMAGFDWGRPFGLPDLMTYQYKTDPGLDRSQSHSLSYTHFNREGGDVDLSSAYSRMKPSMTAPFDSTGKSWQVEGRWHRPLEGSGALSQGLVMGADYKYSDYQLNFSGVPVNDTVTRVAQLVVGYNAQTQGTGWQTGFDGTLYLSPGDIGPHNDDNDYSLARQGASAQYAYLKLNAQGQHALNRYLTAGLALSGQLASTNLLSSEQFAGGGYSAVQGYAENEAYADNGVLASATLRFPAVQLLSRLLHSGPTDQVAPYLFTDGATLWNLHNNPGDRTIHLYSLGAGLSLQYGRYAQGRFSFGVPLKDGPVTQKGHVQIHFALTLSY
ncbi:ShlB/FhaC/HecB family hemolysin secretion/activation protein [Mangrovitalea sediminis]|uniref:ShlB/FhaC/HecB family hemolysin secretion/activation protein n=1 Tax=Mangrovitalea sediminis TaxID=1982043 RepID=UPI000BE5CF48|nr:ShlB/FhaC/HecB family hemolysin secretion/activation protein [Mangrovitalea sediminis]